MVEVKWTHLNQISKLLRKDEMFFVTQTVAVAETNQLWKFSFEMMVNLYKSYKTNALNKIANKIGTNIVYVS